jgi:hypothetical protein
VIPRHWGELSFSSTLSRSQKQGENSRPKAGPRSSSTPPRWAASIFLALGTQGLPPPDSVLGDRETGCLDVSTGNQDSMFDPGLLTRGPDWPG